MYIYYLKGSKRLAESFGSGTTFKEVSASRFAKIPIPICPMPEQRRIVGKVEALFSFLDAGTESLRKIQAQLKRYRQAVLKAATNGDLTKEWRGNHQDILLSESEFAHKIEEEISTSKNAMLSRRATNSHMIPQILKNYRKDGYMYP